VTSRLVAAIATIALALCAVPARPLAAEPRAAAPMGVAIDRTSVRLGIGQGFAFSTTVTNETDQPLAALVAHLNIASVDGRTYVDPEDWSTDRTQYIAALAPHSSRRLAWSVHAVNAGQLVIYVAVTTRDGPDVVLASDPLRTTVTAVRSIDATSVLPVALSVPAVVLACLLFARYRRRLLA
jgi:hypothetical protein